MRNAILINHVSDMKEKAIKQQILSYLEMANETELNLVRKIMDFDAEKYALIGNVKFYKNHIKILENSGILKYAHKIITTASRNYPISTLDVLMPLKLKKIDGQLKIATGYVLRIAGFKKVSIHVKDGTPTKAWAPIDKTLDEELRLEYFFSLLKDHVKITDRKELDSLI